MNNSEKKAGCFIIGLIMGLAAVFALFGSFTIIPPGHRGITVTLGKVDPRIKEEGFNFKKPFIDSVKKVPIQQITINGNTDCFSADLQTVSVKYSVLYRLPEAKVVELFQQYEGDPYQTLVLPRLEEGLKQITSTYKAEELAKSRDKVKNATLEVLRRDLNSLIDIRDVVITNIKLSDDLEKAIEKKQVTEQEALAKEYELQKANKEAEIMVVNAQAEAQAIKIKGEALKETPEVIQIDLIKKWNGVSPTTVVVNEGGAQTVLPLK